jgi:DNA-binding response OmpR family regulator
MAQRSKILIVDDEPFNIDVLEQLLEELGYATVVATNGQEALSQVAAEPPDLILLDVMMPIMDGFTVCRMLKDQESTRLIPVIIMTALGAVEDRIKGIEAGADDFLTKPVYERELLARIHTALRFKHTVDRRLGELRRVKEHFAKFVPETVQRLIAANPETPELAKYECDVSVLFLDISGYSRLSEILPPDMLNTLVERYFSTFLDRIHEAGGDINELAGDGFMAIFQNPDPQHHAITAVDTAFALLTATAALNAVSRTHPLAIHMGLNSGQAFVGSTRFEGQRGTRWTFTASGPVTNLASRLASLAAAGQLLLGPETARRLGQRYRLQQLSRMSFHNLTEPVDVYCVLEFC